LYVDLSNLVTHEVFKARKYFDRPPRQHRHLEWWWWACCETPYKGGPEVESWSSALRDLAQKGG
jgi:hypothetical protein